MNEIKLTPEQKKCAEYPLNQKILVINADPGTGKTEVLKQRVLFVHDFLLKVDQERLKGMSQWQRKVILVLAYGKNIAAEIRTKLNAHGLKCYKRLKHIQPLRDHQHICTSPNKCPTYLENMKPLVLVCTIHSLASGINDLVIKKQFQEERRIHVLTATQRVEKKRGLISHDEKNQKFAWKSLGAIKSRKKKLFNYLFRRIEDKYWTELSWKELWKIFSSSEPENVILTRENVPYCRYEINYSPFLSQISTLLLSESKLLAQLEAACQQDKTKNVWLDFEDLITNANNLINQSEQKIWPEFDYILVDECQDLKVETLQLIIKIFGSERTNFTFVGDPKQNIYGFAGARADIFKLLEDYFPSQTHSVIATSFRLTPEIANFANHFIQKFMTYRSSIQTIKPKTGQKPQIIVVGQESDYQLSSQDEIDIKTELEKSELKKSNLVRDKIRMKKLEKHMNATLSIINKLDNPATSKAILYRQGWVGKLLQNWLDKKGIKTNISEMTVNDIIRQVKRYFKGSASEKLRERAANQKSERHRQWLLKSALKVEKEELGTNPTNPKFFSLASFLASRWISENSIFQLAEIVKKIDENSPSNQPLTQDQINEFISQLEKVKNHPGIILSTIHGMKGLEADYVFLIFCDQKILPKKERFSSDWEKREEENLFFTAIIRPKIGLYITTSSEKDCSPFVAPNNLNLDFGGTN